MVKTRKTDQEAALALVEAIVSGGADLRNRLRDLAEAVSKGNALSTDALSGLLSSGSRGGWAKVYAMNEREIRASMAGKLAEIEASMPRRRFKVLASRFAPPDPARYFGDVKAESSALAVRYERLSEIGASILNAARSAQSCYMTQEEGLLASSVHGFIESITESAASLSREFRAIIDTAGEGDVPTLARTHDMMADGLLDFTIALSFAERSLPTSIGVSP